MALWLYSSLRRKLIWIIIHIGFLRTRFAVEADAGSCWGWSKKERARALTSRERVTSLPGGARVIKAMHTQTKCERGREMHPARQNTTREHAHERFARLHKKSTIQHRLQRNGIWLNGIVAIRRSVIIVRYSCTVELY